ncbi:hypothetical protein E3N88_44377 [Mikania micrantha]|uniref:PROP1-like PPR domain-containing protein n=1 Tax=Mikania micrantha TaxID=192012 RepID=A0A5N6LEJ5_9ASTR|nr:hypothetical protein E3N88_44377 [Mikania micrantha]
MSDLFGALLEEIKVWSKNLIKAVDMCWLRKGCLEDAFDVFRQMSEAGTEPNIFTFGTFIDGLFSNGKADYGFKFLKKLKLEEAESVLLDMKNARFAPDVACYCALIQGYCEKRDILKALALHEEMESSGIKTDCVIVSAIMQCLCRLGMLAEAVYKFMDYIESGVFLDEVVFNIAIDALCKLGKMDEAMLLLKEMKRDERQWIEPDVITFNVLAGGLSRCGLFEETLRLLDNMWAHGLEPTILTHSLVIEGLCKGAKVNEAELFFNGLEHKNLDHYAAMMNGYCEANDTTKAFELWFSKHGLVMKRASCLKLLSCLCAEGETKKAFALFKELEASNYGSCKMMYSELISLYSRVGNMRMARWFFDEMIQKGLTPDAVTYTMMLNGYCRENCLKEASYLFNDMKDRGIKPDIITYTVLLHGGGKRADVMRILNEIEELGLTPDVICYTVMIDKHCKSENLQDAVNLFDEMIDRGWPCIVEVTENVLRKQLVKGSSVDRDLIISLLKARSRRWIGEDEVDLGCQIEFGDRVVIRTCDWFDQSEKLRKSDCETREGKRSMQEIDAEKNFVF